MSDGRRELPRQRAALRLANAPTITHPVVRRLCDELGAVVVGWVDLDGTTTTVAGFQYGASSHPEVSRCARRAA